MVLTITGKELRAVPIPLSRELVGGQLTISMSLLLPVMQAQVHTHLKHTSCDTCMTRINSNGNNQISSKTEIRKPYWPLWAVTLSLWSVVLGAKSWCLFHTTEKNRGPLGDTMGMSNKFWPSVTWLFIFFCLCLTWQDAMQMSTQMAWKIQRATDSTKSLLGEAGLLPSKVLWTLIHKSVIYIKK